MIFRFCFVLVMLAATSSQAANWGQWRGPNFNGSTDESNLPTQWSQTENVAWSVAMPGSSGSTPVVWGDHVFVSSTDQKKQTVKAICLDRKSGMVLWQHDVAKGVEKKKNWRSTYAGPSPATDGKNVVFFYGNGELITYDFTGQKKWSKNVGPFAFGWTYSTSPLLFDGKLYIQILQRDVAVKGYGLPGKNDSYLLALDPETGKELWRKSRPSKAKAESLEAFTTPIPYVHQGRKQVLIAGGDALTGHDPATGTELWRWGTWNPERLGHWRLVPSPIAGDGVVVACAPKRSPVYAVKADSEGDAGLLWSSQDNRPVSSDVPTPAFYDGDFFVLSDVRKMLSRVEPKTGKIKWTIETPGRSKYEASPLAADGKLYLINFDGQVSVIDAQDGKVLRTISMEDDPRGSIRSSVIASQGQLYVRTDTTLFCIGK
ncbi:MAG TPA: PQQ-binding-like beta-propeller repeat protein [Pirellulaceae bacterium]|nr:PQQ-binding-like beta-propeller repeat protein [Pirellulaceae bacterium]